MECVRYRLLNSRPVMPDRFRLALAALLLSCSAAAPAATVALRLIGINDFHGNLESTGLSLALPDPDDATKTVRVPTGGAAALAGLVNALRNGAPHSLVLSAGDLVGASPLASSLFRHESTVEIMNRIGLDANAVGNHEFDAGIAELKRLRDGGCADNTPASPATSCALGAYEGAKFPLLAANVIDARSGRPVLAPYVVKRVAGVRVGVIGAVTRSTPFIVVPSGVAGLRFTDEAEAVNRSARELRAQGVHAIVAVFHEGGEVGTAQQRSDWNDERCPGARGRIFEIARQLTRDVDVIFSGHTHQGYRCVVDGRVIIQGTSYGRGVSVVDVAIDSRTQRIDAARTRSINLPVLNERTDATLRDRLVAATPAPYAQALRSAQPDEAVAARVALYTAAAAPKAQQAVGRIGERFARNGHGEIDSAAGRLVADAQLAATQDDARGGAQIAFMNPGGIRTDLECAGAPPCSVTFGQLFTMQPFGNSLVVMTLTGAQLKALLEQQLKRSNEPTFLQPSTGFGYTWRDDAPTGEHVSDMRLNGTPIDAQQRLRVTVNSFLAEGGDGFSTLRQGTDTRGGPQDLDAMLDYFKTHSMLMPDTQARIQRVAR